ncbi:MAG: glycosyltransferase family protein [Breznakibacter sp.]
MRILYAIQGTGNGHMARAHEVVPMLMEYGEVDLLVSGIQTELSLPWPVKYRLYGWGFIFGKQGGIDWAATIRRSRPVNFIKEIFNLPVRKYDLVISDFEPVSAWACILHGVQCIGLSHQSAVLHPSFPKPRQVDLLGKFLLKCYAPASRNYGFHFKKAGNHVFHPIIRSDIRKAKTSNKGHYTVYLPAWSDQAIATFLNLFPNHRWEVFSKHCQHKQAYGNVVIQPVDKDQFTQSFVSCEGILCNAGFETPAEALFMGKKLCVMPMHGQYEQQCNAALLQSMGVAVLEDLQPHSKGKIMDWIASESRVSVDYQDETSDILDDLIRGLDRRVVPGYQI